MGYERVSFGRGMRIGLANGLLVCLSLAVHAENKDQDFKDKASREASMLRQLPAYKHPACDVNALLSSVVARSRESQLHTGDHILAVNGTPLDPDDRSSAFKIVNALGTGEIVHLTIRRAQSKLTVSIPCKGSENSIALHIDALESAAAGNFAACAKDAVEYGHRYVESSALFGLGRQCGIRSGAIAGQDISNSYVTYWTLRLQELRYDKSRLESERVTFLGAVTELQKAGQEILAEEMRRQWNLASGDAAPAIAAAHPALARTAAAAQTPTPIVRPASYARPRSRSSGGCDDGHWIDEVMSDGEVVKLEDGSLWRVDDVDTVTSSLWLPTTDIVVCSGKLINTEDNESVAASRIE